MLNPEKEKSETSRKLRWQALEEKFPGVDLSNYSRNLGRYTTGTESEKWAIEKLASLGIKKQEESSDSSDYDAIGSSDE